MFIYQCNLLAKTWNYYQVIISAKIFKCISASLLLRYENNIIFETNNQAKTWSFLNACRKQERNVPSTYHTNEPVLFIITICSSKLCQLCRLLARVPVWEDVTLFLQPNRLRSLTSPQTKTSRKLWCCLLTFSSIKPQHYYHILVELFWLP